MKSLSNEILIKKVIALLSALRSKSQLPILKTTLFKSKSGEKSIFQDHNLGNNYPRSLFFKLGFIKPVNPEDEKLINGTKDFKVVWCGPIGFIGEMTAMKLIDESRAYQRLNQRASRKKRGIIKNTVNKITSIVVDKENNQKIPDKYLIPELDNVKPKQKTVNNILKALKIAKYNCGTVPIPENRIFKYITTDSEGNVIETCAADEIKNNNFNNTLLLELNYLKRVDGGYLMIGGCEESDAIFIAQRMNYHTYKSRYLKSNTHEIVIEKNDEVVETNKDDNQATLIDEIRNLNKNLTLFNEKFEKLIK